MNEKTKIAMESLAKEKYSLAVVGEKVSFKTNTSGVGPLLELIDKGHDLSCFCAADKVIGKGAALLYAYMNIQEVYGEVVSSKAKEIFVRYKIPLFYGAEVPYIINRQGDGVCPIEKATEAVDDPVEALTVIRNTLKKLSGEL